MLLAGLDIETTGLDLQAGHRLIQIGIHIRNTETSKVNEYVYDVMPVGDVAISTKALEVNGFTFKRLSEAQPGPIVDRLIAEQLEADGYVRDSLIPVGWNVVAFDMPFIRRELPLTSGFFTYPSSERSLRAIDLTALGLLAEYKTGAPYSTIKARVKKQVVETIGFDAEHDALFDAKAAIIALDVFNEFFGARG